MKMEQTECSETSAYKIQTPGNYPKESIQRSEHGESLKSRTEISPPGNQTSIPHTPSPDPSRCGSDWTAEDIRVLTKNNKCFEAVPNVENVV